MSVFSVFSEPHARRELVSVLLISIGGPPLGVFLVLRRMSLMGDVIAHALLPGTAAGFIVAGMSMAAMSVGGLMSGLLVALAAGLASRFTTVREDANLASFYLIFVGAGVWLLARHGSAQDLEDILFGDAARIDRAGLLFVGCVTIATVALLAILYRPLAVASFDPVFLRQARGGDGIVHVLFMMLVVVNMVASYRAVGTLMASALLIIPAVAAHFWTRELSRMIGVAVFFAVVSSVTGLMCSIGTTTPSGPPIVMVAGGIYVISLLTGRFGSLRSRLGLSWPRARDPL